MRSTAILIGPPADCDLLEQQLALLDAGAPAAASGRAPKVLGRVEIGHRPAGARAGHGATPVLGLLEDLETICAVERPELALITLP
ncbi:MAG: hypothetical protein ACK5WX_03070, partial [bacterium]